jgi:glycosyltransferase involved in cell wall biosynthesis
VDENAFGEQVATLLDDPALRERLGRAARAHVVASFSWAKAAQQFSDLIAEAT